MRKIALILMVLLVAGCTFRPKVGAPWMQELLQHGPEGPTNFRLGWQHGCETGIAGTSNRFQRTFYHFRQDYEMAQDPTYYSAWSIAFNYCSRYVFQYLRRNMI